MSPRWIVGGRRRAIEQATPYSEGRRLFVVVETEDEMGDVQQLLALRAETKHLK
jgi:hypothetical protein